MLFFLGCHIATSSLAFISLWHPRIVCSNKLSRISVSDCYSMMFYYSRCDRATYTVFWLTSYQADLTIFQTYYCWLEKGFHWGETKLHTDKKTRSQLSYATELSVNAYENHCDRNTAAEAGQQTTHKEILMRGCTPWVDSLKHRPKIICRPALHAYLSAHAHCTPLASPSKVHMLLRGRNLDICFSVHDGDSPVASANRS